MENTKVLEILDDFLQKHPDLNREKENIMAIYTVVRDAFSNGNRLYICGNGGSAADALHIVGELMKSFTVRRPVSDEMRDAFTSLYSDQGHFFTDHLEEGLPAYALHNSTSLETAYNNDVSAEMVYAQQIYNYGRPGDVLIGISTTGNSKNIVNAVKVAAVRKVRTLAFTGYDGGILKDICDTALVVPRNEVYQVQELHLPIYHLLCIMWESYFFA